LKSTFAANANRRSWRSCPSTLENLEPIFASMGDRSILPLSVISAT
jgi:hypothetical protein